MNDWASATRAISLIPFSQASGVPKCDIFFYVSEKKISCIQEWQ